MCVCVFIYVSIKINIDRVLFSPRACGVVVCSYSAECNIINIRTELVMMSIYLYLVI